jgi:hypothetical protein
LTSPITLWMYSVLRSATTRAPDCAHSVVRLRPRSVTPLLGVFHISPETTCRRIAQPEAFQHIKAEALYRYQACLRSKVNQNLSRRRSVSSFSTGSQQPGKHATYAPGILDLILDIIQNSHCKRYNPHPSIAATGFQDVRAQPARKSFAPRPMG